MPRSEKTRLKNAAIREAKLYKDKKHKCSLVKKKYFDMVASVREARAQRGDARAAAYVARAELLDKYPEAEEELPAWMSDDRKRATSSKSASDSSISS
jgi:hypothetical protein